MQDLLSFNVTDYIIVAIIVVSTLISLVRGFVKEFISLFIWILGFWVATKFYIILSFILEAYIANLVMRQIASFIGLFLLVLIFGAIFSKVFSFLVIKTGLTGTDRFLGMLFGFARGVLLVAIVLLLISSTSFVEDTWWRDSVLILRLQFLVDWLRAFLPEQMISIAKVVQ